MTRQEAIDSQLALLTDASCITGRFYTRINRSGVGVNKILDFNPFDSQFGTRVNTLATCYNRFRFKHVLIRFLTFETDQSGTAALGIKDDVTISGDEPTSVQDVLQYRCSKADFGPQTVPSLLEFKPLETNKWFYIVRNEGSGQDRFTSQGCLYAATGSTGNTSYQIEVNYTLVFAGAGNPGSG